MGRSAKDHNPDTPQAKAEARLAQSIRELMDDRELKPIQLAKEIGVHYDTIIKWRNGDRVPELHFMVALADNLKISLDRLIRGRTSVPAHLRVVDRKNG